MARKKFNELNIRVQRRYKNEGFKIKQNSGLDTETYKGKVMLICSSYGNYKMINSFEDLLNFLTDGRFRNKFNWFYNIKFDFESIVKWLTRDELETLYFDKTIDYEGFKINYLDKKYFSIQDHNNHRYYFYDMYNFLEVKLNTASKRYLNESKLDIVNAELLNKSLDYWIENKENIIKYCIQDAILTKKLADYFWNKLYEHLKFYPKRPFSKGKISEEYFLHHCYIPTINDIELKAMEYAYNAYSGGRFEILQKGYFPSVYTYDIKSAYPAEIANLPDFNLGLWNKIKNDYTSDAYTGFYKCKILVNEPIISPIVKKERNVINVYPNGEFILFLPLQDIEFIYKYYKNVELEIIDGWEFFPDRLEYPFKEEILKLYDWKEKEKDKDIKYCVKIILNSLYGKTIQAIGGNTGKLFNPFYATLITSNTRRKLLKESRKIQKSVISFSTDSIHTTEPLNMPNNPKLGDFALDFQGEGIYLMSDIYTLWNKKDAKYKDKFRGFTMQVEKDYESEEEISLIKILDEIGNNTEYKYSTTRVYHLGECLLHHKKRKIEDINTFDIITKTININGDIKRNWNRNFMNAYDARENNIGSVPLYV